MNSETVQLEKPKPGDRIAQYLVLAPLGSGGMSDVYLCQDTKTNDEVALKIMPVSNAIGADTVGQFILEAEALAVLRHPNIVTVINLGQAGPYLFLATQHIQGSSLYRLARERRLTLREMVSIFSEIANALDHAHAHGIVHRDVKPGNVLVDLNGHVKVIDFGISKSMGDIAIGAEGINTQSGSIVGTLNYMAPELFTGSKPSAASDIYAMGLILYEMLTGRTPFKAETALKTRDLIFEGTLFVPDNLKLMLPAETWTLLTDMTSYDIARRPVSAGEAAKRLSAIAFPNLPRYFNADLVQLDIENLEEVQEYLESQDVDQAEWQFVLSLCVRRQFGISDSEPTEIVNEKLSEKTVNLAPEVYKQALEDYRRDLSAIVTSRQDISLESLTVPTVITAGVDNIKKSFPRRIGK